jgi:hypothetical protein
MFLGILPEYGVVASTLLSRLPNRKRQKVISFLEKRDYLVTDFTTQQPQEQKRRFFSRVSNDMPSE